jgi:hypothetical protein
MDNERRIVYTPYIADLIDRNLKFLDANDCGILERVDEVVLDLDQEGGLASLTKTIRVTDVHGTLYKIIIEEEKW